MIEKEFIVKDVTPNFAPDRPYEIDSITITIEKDIGFELTDILISEYTIEERI
jgi:hypothetical protein